MTNIQKIPAKRDNEDSGIGDSGESIFLEDLSEVSVLDTNIKLKLIDKDFAMYAKGLKVGDKIYDEGSGSWLLVKGIKARANGRLDITFVKSTKKTGADEFVLDFDPLSKIRGAMVNDKNGSSSN